jgi:uncharacterized protein
VIVETIFSTIDEKGTPNFAPMGIRWGEETVTVLPYRSTQTYRNLVSSGHGVANLTDNVLAFVQCGLYDAILPHCTAERVPGVVFKEACSWLELAVISQRGTEERAELQCRVVYKGRRKDFLGFCRAGNAVIEATILATRLAFTDRQKVDQALNHYIKIVEKTGDEREKQAIRLVHNYIRKGDA